MNLVVHQNSGYDLSLCHHFSDVFWKFIALLRRKSISQQGTLTQISFSKIENQASTKLTRQGDPVNTIIILRIFIIVQDIFARITWVMLMTDWIRIVIAAAATFPVPTITRSVCEAQRAGQGNTKYDQIFHVKSGSTRNKKSRGK